MKKIFLAIAMLLSVAGFAQIQSATLTASGLTCSMCSKAIYKALLKVPAIDKVEVDIEKSSYIITFDKNATASPETLKKAVEGAGFAIAKLTFTAAVPKTMVNADTKLSLQGTTYRFIRPNGQTIAPSLQFIFNSQTRLDIGYRHQVHSSMLRTAPNGFLIRLEHVIFNMPG